ncbi:hypothetical protein H109_07211 [Trichophyton interdigitale MR816]|uniref:Uncharacterized protein n=2 Tax=Trichophyton TaxID=5550 RepID=A0A059J001_TRIIM|nr:U3 small nucleolar ribonucleoprotein Lcp5 [Trichophyton equinum CBS 127.97]EZF31846.1 hypothetical protein H101_04559 [Trichophyton interdigitale H6]KDB20832.1 hypothetical protein H109_07211 [Trichophyton interdigitale MR816]
MAIDEKEIGQVPMRTMLESLQQSLSSAASSLPALDPSEDNTRASIIPPADGISLLDTKSEILLSYLQNLVYLVLLQVRKLSSSTTNSSRRSTEPNQDDVVKKLTELRVYLERGVRPLEGRLKYQIDKVLKAADDLERTKAQTSKRAERQQSAKSAGSDVDTADSDESNSGSDSDNDEDDEDEDEEDIDELTYRPNVAAFSRAAEAQEQKQKAAAQKNDATSDGIYRPPKIKPTALVENKPSRRAEREAQRSKKSKAIDEFVNAEMSTAPMVEPSIGSTIRAGGRHVSTQQDRAREEERRAYEETNLIRLPKESKKDRAKRGGNRRGGYGGEEWQGLGEGVDRIHRLTQRKKDGAGSALQRSRKRATEDGPRSDGFNIGERFEKRQKTIASWKR